MVDIDWNIVFGNNQINILLMQTIPWKEARKHQNNSSPSKAAFGFTKDKRFKDSYSALCDSFYNIPTSIGKSQASSIGSGNKISLVTNTLVPSPQNYNISSEFTHPTKGNKFSLGRESFKQNSIFKKSDTPQPGHYNLRTTIGDHKGFSIYSKLPQPVYSNMKNPGPGHYQSLETLNQTGRYIVSNIQGCPGYKIKDYKPYDQNKNTIVPGPGHYNSKENMNESGFYFNSKHQNSRCRSFSKSAKKGLVSLKKIPGPGPGAYNCVSEFGAKML